MQNSKVTGLTKFANPLPEKERENISRDASQMIMQRLTPDPKKAQEEARRAELGHLALELTRNEYFSPQEYLNALNAYEVAWNSGTLPRTDLFGYVSSFLEKGREHAKTLLAAQGIFQIGKRQWVATIPDEQDKRPTR